MKTLSFIGSNKNAGKTTALNFVMQKLSKANDSIIVTSIGINGESTDQFYLKKKPSVKIYKNNLFITTSERLKNHQGLMEILQIFTPPEVSKIFVLARALVNFELVLEGPNSKQELKYLKQSLAPKYVGHTLLIDGSIDRQFLSHPEISDGIYFSVLLNRKKEQTKKINGYFYALNLPQFTTPWELPLESSYKSLAVNEEGAVLYLSNDPAFLDENFLQFLKQNSAEKLYIFLNGALTESLANKLKGLTFLTIILNNFTMYQVEGNLRLNLFLLHKCPVISFFYKEDGSPGHEPRPAGFNLFREDLNEVRI